MPKGNGVGITPIMAGVRKDVERLIAKFKVYKSLRLNDFKEAFKEMKFSLIHCGRTSENELREFYEKLLVIILGYCSPRQDDVQALVCAIYLLYVVYMMQSAKYQMKIRITQKQLKELMAFKDSFLQPGGHYDVLLVIHRLWINQAFHFCMFSDEHNPLNFKRYDAEEDIQHSMPDAGSMEEDIIANLVNNPVVVDVFDMHARYNEAKSKMGRAAALNMLDVDPTVFMKRIAAECKEKIDRRVFAKRYAGERREPGTKSLVKERRAAIREKAYSGVARQAKHRRHRQEGNKTYQSDEDNHLEPELPAASSGIAVEELIEDPEHSKQDTVQMIVKDVLDGRSRPKQTKRKPNKKEKGKPGRKPKPKTADTDEQRLVKRVVKPARPTAPKKKGKKDEGVLNSAELVTEIEVSEGSGSRKKRTAKTKTPEQGSKAKESQKKQKKAGGRPRLSDSTKKAKNMDSKMRSVDEAVEKAIKLAETTKIRADKRKHAVGDSPAASPPQKKKSKKK